MKKIKGFENYIVHSDGKIYSLNRNGFKKPYYDKDGYQSVCLYKDGKFKTLRVHRIVAIEFISNEFNKPYVNHINGVKDDNRVDNLEWVTQSENEIHAHETGLKHKRKKVRATKDGNEIVFKSTMEAQLWLRNNGFPNASRSCISECCNGIRRHSAYKYKWEYVGGK